MATITIPTPVAAGLTIVPAAAFAPTPPGVPDDVAAVDDPIDQADDGGLDDWGLGVLGLAGLERRDDRVVAVDDA